MRVWFVFNGMRQILRQCDQLEKLCLQAIVLAMPSYLASHVSETYMPTLISSVMSLSTFTMYLFHAFTSFETAGRHGLVEWVDLCEFCDPGRI